MIERDTDERICIIFFNLYKYTKVIISLLCIFFTNPAICFSEANWDAYEFRTFTAFSDPGDTITFDIQGISNLRYLANHTFMDYGVQPPIQTSVATVEGYYSNKRERFAVTITAAPASGPLGGYYRTNTLDLYIFDHEDEYENCQWVAASALPLWKPSQNHILEVSGNGCFTDTYCDLFKILFTGYNETGQKVRKMWVMFELREGLPTYPPDPPGDPDFDFKPFYAGGPPGPPGEDWPPKEDLNPPYDEKPDENDGKGPGRCSSYGLPLYKVNAADLSLWITDKEFSYSSKGPDISFIRTYNSAKSNGVMFGPRWQFSYENNIIPKFGAIAERGGVESLLNTSAPSTEAVVHLGDGRDRVFKKLGINASGNPLYESADSSCKDTLTLTETEWVYESKKHWLTYHFQKINSYRASSIGRLSYINDIHGNRVEITYLGDDSAEAGRNFWCPTIIRDAAGRETLFQYNAEGLCSEMTTSDGRKASYIYDDNGNLVQTIDLVGNVTKFKYNQTFGNLEALHSAGKDVSFIYGYDINSRRQISSIIDANGNVSNFTPQYDSEGLLAGTVFSNPMDHLTCTSINSNGQPLSVQNELSDSASITYLEDRPASVTNSRGYTTNFHYDVNGNLVELIDPLGNITQYEYDENGRIVCKTNALGNRFSYTYGEKGEMLSKELPSGATTFYTYNNAGQLLSIVSPMGQVVSINYDQFGNKKQVTDPSGAIIKYGYNIEGTELTSITDPSGNLTKYNHDENGRLTRITHPDGSFIQYHYDCCALSEVVDENGNCTTYSRDKMLNVTKVTDQLGHSTSITYDSTGQAINRTNAVGQQFNIIYDEIHRPTRREGLSGTIFKSYDKAWNVTSFANQAGHLWNISHNATDLINEETDPLNNTTSYQYNNIGFITSTENARGQKINFTYDEDLMLIKKQYSNSICNFEYDLDGQLISYTSSDGTWNLQYDNGGRVIALQFPGGGIIEKKYDVAGRLQSITYPNGFNVNYTYNSRNWCTSVSWPGGRVDNIFDAAGHLIEEKRFNGINTIYNLNGVYDIVNLKHKTDTDTIVDIQLSRNAIGQITGISFKSDLDIGVSSLPMSRIFSYNVADGLSSVNGTAVLNDNDGNLVSDASRDMFCTYDAENKLTQLTINGVTKEIQYDAFGRISSISQDSSVVHYLYDENSRLLGALDNQGKVAWFCIYNGSKLLARGTPATDFNYYHFDHQGNTLFTSNVEGCETATYGYQPFGRVSLNSGNPGEPFTMLAAYSVLDIGSGIYGMRHRFYDAHYGRFLQKDRVGFYGGANLYSYSANNPINYIDHTGLSGEWADFTMWNGRSDYTTNTAGGTWDVNWGLPPHMADAATDDEMLILGTAAAASMTIYLTWAAVYNFIPAATAATPAVCDFASRGQAHLEKVVQTYQGKIPGVDPRSSIALDWLINAPMPAKDKARVFTGVIEYGGW